MTTIDEFNVKTGEIIQRPMSNDELAQQALDAEKAKIYLTKLNAEISKKAAQRQAILDRLGLTTEEAALLLGAN